MPLSEEELRMLEQMERALVEDDPKLASTMRGTALRRATRRRTLLAAAAFLIGVAVLLAGAIMSMTVVGVVGFGIMLVTAMVGLASYRTPVVTDAAPDDDFTSGGSGFTVLDGGKARKQRRPKVKGNQNGSFMERLEDRWRRRDEGNGGY